MRKVCAESTVLKAETHTAKRRRAQSKSVIVVRLSLPFPTPPANHTLPAKSESSPHCVSGYAVSTNFALCEYTVFAFFVSDEDGNEEVTIANAEKTYTAAYSLLPRANSTVPKLYAAR